MDTDKRLLDENGRVLPYLKPIAENRAYFDFNAANSILGNIHIHYPELKCEIAEKNEMYFIVLIDEIEYYI